MRLSAAEWICARVFSPIVPGKEKSQALLFFCLEEPEVTFHEALSPLAQYKHTLAPQTNQALTYCRCHTKHRPQHQEIIQQKRHLK